MGLISKTVKVKWNSKNKKHYEELGYVYTKMGEEFEVKVKDLTKSSKAKVECICDNCKKKLPQWTYKDYNRFVKENGKTYCQKCGTLLIGKQKTQKTKLQKSKSFYDWCIENNRNDLLLRWDCELNKCKPSEVCYGSNINRWFKCLLHPEHKSELKNLNSFTSGQENSMDCSQCKSIAQYIIDNYGEEFLWRIWSNKNIISPFEISLGSNKKVWWKCLDNKHEEYLRSCKDSKNYKFKCPKCSEEKEVSELEEKTKKYLELKYKVKTEHECSLKIINPKTNHPLPFDNEIILENEKHLIIEVHGSQHYIYGSAYCRTKEDLHYRQLKDRYKRIKCIQAGYEYLEIPYTAFDKKDTYKKLIDDKIKNILDK